MNLTLKIDLKSWTNVMEWLDINFTDEASTKLYSQLRFTEFPESGLSYMMWRFSVRDDQQRQELVYVCAYQPCVPFWHGLSSFVVVLHHTRQAGWKTKTLTRKRKGLGYKYTDAKRCYSGVHYEAWLESLALNLSWNSKGERRRSHLKQLVNDNVRPAPTDSVSNHDMQSANALCTHYADLELLSFHVSKTSS